MDPRFEENDNHTHSAVELKSSHWTYTGTSTPQKKDRRQSSTSYENKGYPSCHSYPGLKYPGFGLQDSQWRLLDT